MPVNKKELILQRILEVLDTVEGIKEVGGEKSVFRNRAAVINEKRPALVLLDGVLRTLGQTTQGNRQNRSFIDDEGHRVSPSEMMLQPQIFILLPLAESSDNRDIGAELSEFELRVLAALFHDDDLWELLGGVSSGKIEYRGNDTDMQTGSSMEGQMQLDVAFTYPFDPADLR